MASILIKLDKRRDNAEGKYPVKIVIFNNQTNASMSLSFDLPVSAWIKDGLQRPVRQSYPAAKMLNDKIEKIYLDVRGKIFELEESGEINSMKASEIKSYILADKVQPNKVTFYSVANDYIGGNSYEVCTFLRISERTLQRLRSSGQVSYSIISGKSYYQIKELKRLLKAHLIKSEADSIDDLIVQHQQYNDVRRKNKSQ